MTDCVGALDVTGIFFGRKEVLAEMINMVKYRGALSHVPPDLHERKLYDGNQLNIQ